MAGNGQALLQVGEFSLAGVDTTQRKTVVEGTVLNAVVAGSAATIAIAVAGTGFAANDTFTLANFPGFIGKVTAVTSTVPTAIAIVAPGSGGVATTGAVATAVAPSGGTGLTVTTTVNTGGVAAITGWSITSNVATFTANNSFTTGGGQAITVQGFTGSYTFLNGTFTTNSATPGTILVPLTHANGSGSQQGVATLQPTYTTGGIPLIYGFVDQLGRPNPIGTIGPLSVPTWAEAQSVAGSAFNYKINTTVTPNTLLIFSGITQVSDAASIMADTVAFRMEFLKNAF